MRVLAAATLLLAVAGCGPAHYRLTSSDANYSQDPRLVVSVAAIDAVEPSRVRIELRVKNDRREPVALSGLRAVLLDSAAKEVPAVSLPSDGEIAPGASRTVTLVFDRSHAAHGAFSMRLVLPVAPSEVGPNNHETRIWPINFSDR